MSKSIYHSHHIIPRHAGGTDHPDNIARLTVEEHVEAHRKLYEKYGRWQDRVAYEGLLGFKGKEQIIKEIQSRPKSEEEKKNMSIAAYKRTDIRKHSEETKKKMSETAKKQNRASFLNEQRKKVKHKRGEEHPMYGKTHSEETKKKMSESAKKR
jgi:hypothetical protein